MWYLTLLWIDTDGVAVETGTVYKVGISNRSGSIYSVSDVSPNTSSYDIIVPCDIEDYAKIEVWSERDSVASRQKVVFEGELPDLVMEFGMNLTTGQLTVTMNTRNPTTFAIVNGELEVATPSDYHTVYSAGTGEDTGYLIRTYEV